MTARAAAALAAAGLIVAGAVGRPAAAAGPGPRSVTVFLPADAGEALVEVATRTWAELVAGGFAARIVECSVASGKCRNASWRGLGATATVSTFEYAGDTLIEVTATADEQGDPRGILEVVRAEQTGVAPKVLAIRAVELLRATLLEAVADPEESRAAPAPVEVAQAVETVERTAPRAAPPPPAPLEGWSLALGAARLTTSSRLDTGYGAVIRVGRRWAWGAGLSLLFAGIEFTPDLQVFEGSLFVHQEMALLEGPLRFRGESRLQPYVTGGLGGYHVGVKGGVASQPGLVGQDADAWQAVETAGGGVTLVLSGFGVFVEGQVMIAAPQVVVGAQAEEIGGPRLLISSGMQWIF